MLVLLVTHLFLFTEITHFQEIKLVRNENPGFYPSKSNLLRFSSVRLTFW